MVSKKKLNPKVQLFYRGPVTKPSRVASQDDMRLIRTALEEVIPKKNSAFSVNWLDKPIRIRVIIGLSAGLRSLKHKKSIALIYDDTAAAYLVKYLNYFAIQSNLPIIQAHRLIDLAPKVGLNTLLLISLVDLTKEPVEIQYGPSQPKPNSITETVELSSFNSMCALFHPNSIPPNELPSKVIFQPPQIDKVEVISKNKPKKTIKASRIANINKTT